MERWKLDAAGLPKGSKPPPPPKPRRIDIDDATMEVLPIILADNPRGLIMIRDELSAFILGMNQFKGGKGNDRSNALKIWSGDRIVKDRVNHENNEPIRCPHPALSIVGGLTPDMLGELADPRGRADGFIDRFLLAYPDPLPVADWSEPGHSRGCGRRLAFADRPALDEAARFQGRPIRAPCRLLHSRGESPMGGTVQRPRPRR